MQLVRTLKVDTHSLVVEALFATNGAAGSATIHLTGPSGEIGNTAVSIPASAGTTTLTELRFEQCPRRGQGGHATATDRRGHHHRAPAADGAAGSYPLDLRRYEELSDTLKFLAETPHRAAAAAPTFWRRSVNGGPPSLAPRTRPPISIPTSMTSTKSRWSARLSAGLLSCLPTQGSRRTSTLTPDSESANAGTAAHGTGPRHRLGHVGCPATLDLERLGIDGIVDTAGAR